MPKALSSRLVALAATLLIFPFAVHVAHAQVLTGSMLGNVTDPSGAGVPAAAVKITQVETNESREAQTNDTGVFSFPAIPAGTYTVEVRKAGFQTAIQREIVVQNNTVVRADSALQVGTVNQNVEVTGGAAA